MGFALFDPVKITAEPFIIPHRHRLNIIGVAPDLTKAMVPAKGRGLGLGDEMLKNSLLMWHRMLYPGQVAPMCIGGKRFT